MPIPPTDTCPQDLADRFFEDSGVNPEDHPIGFRLWCSWLFEGRLVNLRVRNPCAVVDQIEILIDCVP